MNAETITEDRSADDTTGIGMLDELRRQAMDPRLGAARILVVEADSGRLLLERAADLPAETASVMKTITCAAALHVLGPNHRIATRVVRGAMPGEVVLVGGGDVTLSRVPGDGATYYTDPPRLDELARRTLDALCGTPPVRIVLDDSLFAGGEWRDDQWEQEDRDPNGDMPLISSLQTDGDRDDPASDDGPRGADPTGRAGAAFASFLGGSPELVRGTAPVGAEVLASVESRPVEALVRECLKTSDNALAEALAKLSAIALGSGPGFDEVGEKLRGVLAEYGVPVDGVELLDGSGMSAGIRVPARTVVDLLRRARLREGALGLLDDRLTRTGPNGTMHVKRFVGENTIIGDAVRAKTGYICSVHSLAGVVRTVGGAELIFGVFAMGDQMPPAHPARTAVDDFTVRLHLLGDALLDLEGSVRLDP